MSFDAFDCVLITVTCLNSSKTSRGEREKEKSCLIVCPLQLNHRNNRWAQNRHQQIIQARSETNVCKSVLGRISFRPLNTDSFDTIQVVGNVLRYVLLFFSIIHLMKTLSVA